MQLRTLIAKIPAATADGEVEVLSLTDDSRRVEPGALFVSVPGLRQAGKTREHVDEALSRGAVAVVTQDDLKLQIPTVRVDDTRQMLGLLAATFYGHPSRDLALFGVTGTDGKTTTTYLLEHVLRASGLVTGLVGTVETRIAGEGWHNSDRMTTPGAVEIQTTLRAMVDRGVTHAAIEASSHGLALGRLRGCHFAAVALTNLTGDHIEFHGSREAYFAAKASLFRDHRCPAVLNRDDPSFERFAAAAAGPVVTYGFHPDAELRAERVRRTPGGQLVDVRYGGQTVLFSLALPGRYNVSNALAAAGLALVAGLPLDRIASGLSTASPPPGRFERIQSEPFSVIVDYAHTINAFTSVLSLLRAQTPPPRRLLVVFGAAGGRDRAKRPNLARIAREYADYFVITNEDPGPERAEAIIAEIAGGVPAVERGTRYDCRADRGEAIELAIRRARPGDTVAILGKGHERTIDAGDIKIEWSDTEAARQILGRAS